MAAAVAKLDYFDQLTLNYRHRYTYYKIYFNLNTIFHRSFLDDSRMINMTYNDRIVMSYTCPFLDDSRMINMTYNDRIVMSYTCPFLDDSRMVNMTYNDRVVYELYMSIPG